MSLEAATLPSTDTDTLARWEAQGRLPEGGHYSWGKLGSRGDNQDEPVTDEEKMFWKVGREAWGAGVGLDPVLTATQELEAGYQGLKVSLSHTRSSLGYIDSNEKKHRENVRNKSMKAECSLGTPCQGSTPLHPPCANTCI